MTDEERQKQLVKDLREEASCWSVPQASVILCEKAADEIERLAAELKQVKPLAFVDAGANPARTWKEAAERLAALVQSDTAPGHTDLMVSPESIDAFMEANPLPKQSDAKPVAWRVRDFGDGWILCHSRKQAEKEADAGNLVQPLYTAPPRADTSAADYDRAWGAIATSDELANVRRKLSIHELRLLIRVVLTGSARAAGRIWK